jgi:hypothetical protein
MDIHEELTEVAYSVASNTAKHDEGCGPNRTCRCSVVERAKEIIERDWRKKGLWK